LPLRIDHKLHSHGGTHCWGCGNRPLVCPSCEQETLHKIKIPDSKPDYVCSQGCSKSENISATWRDEMRRALEGV
jgi:hypothetical protein